jgi:hypothetical protein
MLRAMPAEMIRFKAYGAIFRDICQKREQAEDDQRAVKVAQGRFTVANVVL